MTPEKACQILSIENPEEVFKKMETLEVTIANLKDLADHADDLYARDEHIKNAAELEMAIETLKANATSPRDNKDSKRKEGHFLKRMAGVCFLLAILILGSFFINRLSINHRRENLMAEAAEAFKNGNFESAQEKYNKVLKVSPSFSDAKDKLDEVKNQRKSARLDSLISSARLALQNDDLDDANAIANDLSNEYSDDVRYRNLLDAIEKKEREEKISGLILSAQEAVGNEEWESLSVIVKDIETIDPKNSKLEGLKNKSIAGLKVLKERRSKATSLYRKALALDTGIYSVKGLEALAEAITFDAKEEYSVLYQKMSSYPRVIKVPGDYSTLSEAINVARKKDKVQIGKGIYRGCFSLPSGLEIEGAGKGNTIVECEATQGSVFSVLSGGQTRKISKMTIRHVGIVLEEDRYPVLAVKEGECVIESCTIVNGSGHGIAVFDGGNLSITDSTVMRCGWDGICVYGNGSKAILNGLTSANNLHHGVDVWDGGNLIASNSVGKRNGRCGFNIMAGKDRSVLKSCSGENNRGIGFSVSDGTEVEMLRCVARNNLLGGYFFSGLKTNAVLRNNKAIKNTKAGFFFAPEVTLDTWEGNTATGNDGIDIWNQKSSKN